MQCARMGPACGNGPQARGCRAVIRAGAERAARSVRAAPPPPLGRAWIPPSGRRLYVRIREPVATGLGAPCPGPPWGLVNRYQMNGAGQLSYPPGGPRDQNEAQIRGRSQGGHKWLEAAVDEGVRSTLSLTPRMRRAASSLARAFRDD